MREFNIYFSDLNEDAQKRLCERFETSPDKENWDRDVFPIAILEREIVWRKITKLRVEKGE